MVDFKILVKIPSRSRPAKFLALIKKYIEFADDKNIQYIVSIDNDDISMNAPYVQNEMRSLGLRVFSGVSKNKIHAINRDLEKAFHWDILVNGSDDMVCITKGWDTILKTEMMMYFPDTDGVLWHWDGDKNTQGKLNTMCIMGRKYFERFGYIYHPDYISLWSDNQFTEVSLLLNKCYESNIVLFKHEHFSNNINIKPDELMKKTQSYFKQDQITFYKHKENNFGL